MTEKKYAIANNTLGNLVTSDKFYLADLMAITKETYLDIGMIIKGNRVLVSSNSERVDPYPCIYPDLQLMKVKDLYYVYLHGQHRCYHATDVTFEVL